MKVSEMIKCLSELPQDLEVVMEEVDGYNSSKIEKADEPFVTDEYFGEYEGLSWVCKRRKCVKITT